MSELALGIAIAGIAIGIGLYAGMSLLADAFTKLHNIIGQLLIVMHDDKEDH